MSDGRSGAAQTFAIADVTTGTPSWTDISFVDSGFTGFTATPTDATYTNTSAGLTTTKKGNHVQRTSAFGVGENATTIPILLGRNGRRAMIRNRPQGDGTGLPEEIGEVIMLVSRAFAARGARTFAVAVTHDGDFPETTQT